MNKIAFILIVAGLFSTIVFAQTPQAFKYQAIVRTEAGDILSNQDIGIRISILKGGQDGKIVSIETHQVKSNVYGIINLVIGEGESLNGEGRREKGEFSDIDWGSDRFYIKLEMCIDGKEDYKEMGTSQLYAVPYALYADEAGKVREQQEQTSSVSNIEDKTSSQSNQTVNQGGSRDPDPNTKLSSIGNSYFNTTSGNVGVGMDSPTEKLEVDGNIKTRGAIITDGEIKLLDSKGNPRKIILNSDDTWTSMFNCEGYIKDIRDGIQYSIIKIGTQCWMAENLNMGTRVDASTGQQDNGVIEKYCYNDNESNCDLLGGLYKWDEMMKYTSGEGIRGICPESWHIPTDWEFKILEGNVDSNFGVGDEEWDGLAWRGFDAGTKLKSTNGWYNNGNGTDDYNFTALPAGVCGAAGSYQNITRFAFFWSSRETGVMGWGRALYHEKFEISRGTLSKNNAYSVRCLKDFECGDTITDVRDGIIYGTVKIGDQCWMSQNLNVGIRIDGNTDQTNTGTIEKYCYGDTESNCDLYGGLYQWDQAMNYISVPMTQGICPEGWHLPADEEWTVLTDNLGGTGIAGGKLKSTGTIQSSTGLWNAPNTGATNESGFTALPVGERQLAGTFNGLGNYTVFWSSSESGPFDVWNRSLNYQTDNIYQNGASEDFGNSVRCIKD